MKYQLILQWPASSLDDYDMMISVENSLIEELSGDDEVDGHDGGSGQVNIFIRTDNPTRSFENIRKILKDFDAWSDVRAAYRERTKSDYTILWPKSLKDFRIS